MTHLSVNINKIATLRNARGGNLPDLQKIATDIEAFGAQGITVHPRPDERHIRYEDVRELKKNIKTELNIEGNPIKTFIQLVLEVKPQQVTLVPDAQDAITSNAGWNTLTNEAFLTEVIKEFKSQSIRTSIFLDPDLKMVEAAARSGVDRIELYTGPYALAYASKNPDAIKSYLKTAKEALNFNLQVNAGHDLNLENIEFFIKNIPEVCEVSIGHALVCEALYLGLENTIGCYLRKLQQAQNN